MEKKSVLFQVVFAACFMMLISNLSLADGEKADESTPEVSEAKTGPEAPAVPPASNGAAATETEKTSSNPSQTSEIKKPAPVRVTSSPFTGRLSIVNQKKKFAVIEFSKKGIPPVDSELGVYRDGNFVGSIRITLPIRPPFASADILTGTLHLGDTVR